MNRFTTKNVRGVKFPAERGFTLMELAVVICILAIIIAVAVPVLLLNRKKAEHTVAINNLMVGARTVDNLWYNRLASQEGCPLVDGAYRDYDPPPEYQGGSGDYVNIDAQYMSFRERKITWVDLSVGGAGASAMIASADLGMYAQVGGGFRINAVWKNGEQIMDGMDVATDWTVLPHTVAVVENMYWWDGAWQDNSDNQYLTLMTYEPVGIAHFYTLRVGVTIAGGTFNWDNGMGTPGDSYGDELADGPPPDNPPPPPPDTGPEPPPPPPQTDPEPPPQTDPEPPPQTEPEPPGPPEIPPGDNQADEIKINPQALNLDSHGIFHVTITFASGYEPENVNPSTVRAYGAAPRAYEIRGKGLVLTFHRDDLIDSMVPVGDSVLFVVTGQYYDGTVFQAWDYIKVIDNH